MVTRERRRRRLERASLVANVSLLITLPFALVSLILKFTEGEGFLPPGLILFVLIASMHFSHALQSDKAREREKDLLAEIARKVDLAREARSVLGSR